VIPGRVFIPLDIRTYQTSTAKLNQFPDVTQDLGKSGTKATTAAADYESHLHTKHHKLKVIWASRFLPLVHTAFTQFGS